MTYCTLTLRTCLGGVCGMQGFWKDGSLFNYLRVSVETCDQYCDATNEIACSECANSTQLAWLREHEVTDC